MPFHKIDKLRHIHLLLSHTDFLCTNNEQRWRAEKSLLYLDVAETHQ